MPAMTRIADLKVADIIAGEVQTIAPGSSLWEVAGLMARAPVSCVVVVAPDAGPRGLLTVGDLVRLQVHGVAFSTSVSEVVRKGLPSVPIGQDLRSAYVELRRCGVGQLIAEDEGRMAGLVSSADVYRRLGAAGVDLGADMESAMERDIPRLSPDSILAEAIAAMARDGRGLVLVMEAGRVLGTLGEAEVEETTDAIFVKDRSGVYTLANRAVARLLGRPLGEILGRDDFALFPPETAERFRADDRRVIESGATEIYEEPVITPGGAFQYLVTKGPLVVDAEVRGVFGIARDMTEERRGELEREAQLAELRRWHEAMLGRESRFLELKCEVNTLLAELGRSSRYHSVEEPEDGQGNG